MHGSTDCYHTVVYFAIFRLNSAVVRDFTVWCVRLCIVFFHCWAEYNFYLMIIFFFFFAFWSTPPIRVFRSYQNKLHSFLLKFHINYRLIQSIPSLLWCELVQHVDIHGRMHGLQLHVVYGYLLGPFKSSGQLLFMSVCAYV